MLHIQADRARRRIDKYARHTSAGERERQPTHAHFTFTLFGRRFVLLAFCVASLSASSSCLWRTRIRHTHANNVGVCVLLMRYIYICVRISMLGIRRSKRIRCTMCVYAYRRMRRAKIFQRRWMQCQPQCLSATVAVPILNRTRNEWIEYSLSFSPTVYVCGIATMAIHMSVRSCLRRASEIVCSSFSHKGECATETKRTSDVCMDFIFFLVLSDVSARRQYKLNRQRPSCLLMHCLF